MPKTSRIDREATLIENPEAAQAVTDELGIDKTSYLELPPAGFL